VANCPLALFGNAFYAVLVHRLAIYAPRFLPTLGRPHAVALRFTCCDQLVAGLAPAGLRPCWAHNLERLLTLEGFEVSTASNGKHGLALACSMLPDILITDVNMPVMDGFALLDAVRAQPELQRTVVIMLTAAEDRMHMRKGMRLGADDYITKPFKREDLLESIWAQLKKIKRFDHVKDQAISHAVNQAATRNEEQIQENFRQRYGVPDSDFAPPSNYSSLEQFGKSGFAGFDPLRFDYAQAAGTTLQATVLFADIRNFTTIAERLSASELANMLGRYFELACRPAVAYGGTHLKMLGDGLLALFEDDADVNKGLASTHASRAMSAAMAMGNTAQAFRQWMLQTYGERNLPEFNVGVGLHSGEVTLGQLGSGAAREITPLGDTVNIASRLQTAGKDLGWLVVASTATTSQAGGDVFVGRQQVLHIRGRAQSVSACEVLGYQTGVDLDVQP
jgi:serine/threonine-protein kinase PpkA